MEWKDGDGWDWKGGDGWMRGLGKVGLVDKSLVSKLSKSSNM